jgi:hypothetical protein
MTLIPAGTWRARGVSAELGYTKENNEQVGVALQFSPGQDPAVDGQTLTWYGSFSEKSELHTLKALRALGWSSDSLADLSGVDAAEVEVVVMHEPDLQGQLRARVRFINPIGSGGVAMRIKMSAEQAAEFAERMRGRVLALGAKAPQPRAAPPSQRAPAPARAPRPPANPANAVQAPEGDDLPF